MASLPEPLSTTPAGRHPLSREVVARYQRDRVIDSAIETFAKRGYLGTTVDHIVASARIGVGTFYELFDGKEDCFLRTYDRVVADARERLAAAIPSEAPWPEQACCALRALVDLIAAEPFPARIALVEAQTAGPVGLGRYEASLDSVVPLLRRGRELSPIADELPASLEIAIVGGLAWFLQQRLVMGELPGIEELLPELVEIVVEPYLGEAATAESIVATGSAQTPG